jgi:hypothetical protein
MVASFILQSNTSMASNRTIAAYEATGFTILVGINNMQSTIQHLLVSTDIDEIEALTEKYGQVVAATKGQIDHFSNDLDIQAVFGPLKDVNKILLDTILLGNLSMARQILLRNHP